ncbi:MAG: xanthine dehydrogenase family protein [Actinobacteria bacterium]|nr:xanthine dehydrogenase family protein [Actinomycetota bacterium]
MSVVEQPALRVVGRELVRHDAVEKVTGRTRYAADVEQPRRLHAALRRSDVAHGRLRRVDVTPALAVPGVVGAYTAADVPNNVLWAPVPGQLPGTGAERSRANMLAEDVVRFDGEPIALVAAETEDAAAAGVEAVVVEIDPLPVLDDPLRSLDEDVPVLHEGGNLLASWEFEEGDVDAALVGAAAVVDRTHRCQAVDHAYLETEAGTAWIDADGVVVVRASTQVVEHHRTLARFLGVEDNRVRVIAPYVGGGFGGKEDLTVEPYLAFVAHRTRRPVRMTWSRQESLRARAKRHPAVMHYVTAADAGGRLVAQDIDLVLDGGAYAQLSAAVLLWSAMSSMGPYRCANVRVRARVVYTNNTPSSAMRGFGAQQVAFAYENQMDALAAALGIDPLALRRRNFIEAGDTLATGQVIPTHVALPELTAAVEERLGELPQPSGPARKVGRGYACNLQSYGFNVWMGDWSSAWVGLEADGGLTIRIGVPDIGAGQASSLVQIAAEVVGVEPERIVIHIGDSTLTPLTGRTSSSRQLYMSGNAVLEAAERLADDLRGVAAMVLEVDADAVELAAGEARAGEDALPLAAAYAACIARSVPVQQLATFHAPTGPRWEARPDWRGRIVPDFAYSCHGVEVEVDTETGRVQILRYVAAHDVGRAINPQSVRGQIEGGATMGIGQALYERVVFEDARNVTRKLANYLVPTAVEAPEIETIVLESGEGLGPFHSRGVGEPPVSPPAPAIAAALRDATGATFTATPFAPERVLATLAAHGVGR